jgi:hypothetical protein
MTKELDIFTTPASEETLQLVAKRLQERNIEALIVDSGDEARKLILERLPMGVEVHSGKSKTLQEAGITELIQAADQYDALRPRYLKMDRQTQGREIRKLGASPEYAAGSVHAITEDGHVLIASMSGSQLGPYASGAGKVIWVAGAQKIVKDVNDGLQRIEEYTYPLEIVHAKQLYNMDTGVNKVLIVNREIRPGRTTLIIVKELLGF